MVGMVETVILPSLSLTLRPMVSSKVSRKHQQSVSHRGAATDVL